MEITENTKMMQDNTPIKLTYDAATGAVIGLHLSDDTLNGKPYIFFPDSMSVDDLNCVEEGMEWVVLSGVLQKRKIVYTQEEKLEMLRFQREKECFPYINRGTLWYNTLTDFQKQELAVWYRAWLDVTVTLIPPVKPIWLK